MEAEKVVFEKRVFAHGALGRVLTVKLAPFVGRLCRVTVETLDDGGVALNRQPQEKTPEEGGEEKEMVVASVPA